MGRTPRVRPVLQGFIGLVTTAAAVGIAFGSSSIADAVRDQPLATALLVSVSVALQLVSLSIAGKASLGVSAVGTIAAAIILGTAPAMALGAGLALAQFARRRGLAHRALFDASNLALAAGTAGVVYDALVPTEAAPASVLAAAAVAGAAYSAVNLGLLCVAIGLSESRPVHLVWSERFEWAWFALLAFGPIAGVAAINYDHSRAGGVLSLLLLPLFLELGMRRQLADAGLRGTGSRAGRSAEA